MTDAESFFRLATQFLRLAENAADLLVRGGNALVVVTDKPISPKQYSRKTRWSDHSVGIAILFSFYHGVELTLKGCLALHGSIPQNHKLTSLVQQLASLAPHEAITSTLIQHVSNVDGNLPLGRFLAANQISINAWYQALKYPKATSGKAYSHVPLQYGGTSTVAFWRSIKRSAYAVRKHAVEYKRKIAGA